MFPLQWNIILSSHQRKEMNFEDATKYRQIVGSLIYVTTITLDMSFVVVILCRFIQKSCEGNWSATKRVLKYLKGTQDFRLKYSKVNDFNLIGYCDSDFVRDKENGVSNSSYLTSLGSTTVSWRSHKQLVLADSTTKEEYVVAAKAKEEIVWLRKILEYLREK
jgi:hypothetical protein